MSESLKVITYFDELIAGGVGVPSLLRGAALLSGTIAGVEVAGRVTRMVATGAAPPAGAHGEWPERRSTGGRVWLERTGEPNANDELILERVGLALDVLASRRLMTPENSVAVAIDADHPVPDRVAALDRLRIVPSARVRLVVAPVDVVVLDVASTVYPTARGLVRVVIDTGGTLRVRRAGVGARTRADRLPASLPAAVAALRLTDDRIPRIDAADLGSLLPIVLDAVESGHADADLAAVRALDAQSRLIADALAEHDSVRAAAAALGLHHSTVHARHDAITEQLGWDPRSVPGRMRYIIARMCQRVIGS
ncbi:helix-turn-helix domain-containing protein [Actinosynnema sp. NPDC059335]|uniref:helix-turn-helix domain-containing protein n=1 Tax=Actinosynnema sp. NPDC059335 TaxID=3346804 RepID=UPI00366AE71F